MDHLTCMRAFAAVAETGGFSRAARRTGISKALLSKYVAQLEEHLGVRLLHRTTRQVRLTTTGRAYLERSLPLLAELEELEASVRETHAEPAGTLRVHAPLSFAELQLMGPLAAFRQRHPRIEVELLLGDRLVDLVEEGVDLALRIAELPDSSLVARRLAPVRLVCCAGRDYLEPQGRPDHPEDLTRHRCLVDTNSPDAGHWAFRDGERTLRVPVRGGFRVNSARAIRELALAGQGIARIPLFVVADDLRSGRLELLLAPFEPPPLGLYAVYPHRRHLSARVRLLIDLLAERFGEPPWALAASP